MKRLPAWIVAGLAVALAGGPAYAAAADYVVVASTDPATQRGQELAAGQHLALPPGRSVTVMHASGAVLVLKGAPGGADLPRRVASAADADRMGQVMKLMVSGPPKASRTRALVACPEPSALADLDAIAEAAREPACQAQASQALDAYLATHTPPQ
jgi:hypothetical protein